MYQKIFKSLTLIILTIISIQLSYANDMKVASGECALSEKDQKKYSRYGNDPSKYRDLPLECAERKCYQKALLNEFNSLVTEKDAEKFKAKFESEIYPVAAGYITDRIYVSEEIKSPGILVLTYKVSVDTESLKEGLKSIGVSFDVKTRKTVMVLIEEYFTPDYVPSNQGAIKKEVIKTEKLKMMEIDNVEIKSDRQEVVRDDGGSFKANEDVDEEYMLNMEREREKTVREFFPPDLTRSKRDKSFAGAVIQENLLKKDVRILDQDYTKKIRNRFVGDDKSLVEVMVDNESKIKMAMSANREFGANYAIIGGVAIIYNGKVNGLHSATANLVSDMIDCSSGDVVFTVNGNETSTSSKSAEESATRAAKKLGSALGPNAVNQLLEYIIKRENKGTEYKIMLNGVNQTKFKYKFVKMLKTLENTVDLYEQIYDKNEKYLEVDVTFKGSADDFKNALFEYIFEVEEDCYFCGVDEELSVGNTIKLRLNE